MAQDEPGLNQPNEDSVAPTSPDAPWQASPDKTKITLCKLFPQGRCRRGHACWFAHGQAELRPHRLSSGAVYLGMKKVREADSSGKRRGDESYQLQHPPSRPDRREQRNSLLRQRDQDRQWWPTTLGSRLPHEAMRSEQKDQAHWPTY